MRNVILATIAIGLAAYSYYEPASPITAAAMATQSAPLEVATAGTSDVYVTVVNLRSGKADVNIHNTSGQHLKSVFLHCMFRDARGNRIDVAPVMAHDIAASETARETASIPGRIIAAEVACRTEHVRKA